MQVNANVDVNVNANVNVNVMNCNAGMFGYLYLDLCTLHVCYVFLPSLTARAAFLLCTFGTLKRH